MKLIQLDNYEIKVADEALLVKPIRRLFNMDRSKGKERFYEQMSVLYFVYDPRSNYSYIIDEKDRFAEVLKQEGIKEFHNTAEFKEAVEVYKKLTMTTSAMLLADTRVAIDKVREFLRTVDLNAVDDKGKPLYTINSITSTIKQIPQLAKELVEAEEALNKEVAETGKARGTQELSIMDNPNWGM